MRQAVEQRHNRRLRAHRRRDRFDCRVKVVGLAGEKNDVIDRRQRLGEHGVNVSGHWAQCALDAQAVVLKLRAACRAHEEGHVRTAFDHSSAEIAADRAGAQNQNLHAPPA